MRLNLTADELLTTTRAVRKRLDLERPVEREVIAECIEIAVQAPTGSNSQGWHWVVVTEAETKQALADLYRPGYAAAYGDVPDAPYTGTDPRGLRMEKVKSSSDFLAEHLHEVPAMVIVCQRGRVEGASPRGARAGARSWPSASSPPCGPRPARTARGGTGWW